MTFQNLIVTGLVKLLKKANIDTLVVEKLNEITKNELDTLQGVTSNIQDQINSVSSSLETAELEQTNWKTRVASAVNAIPKKNPTGLTKTSALVKFESELKNTQDAIEGVTAVAANVLRPKKFVGSNGWLTEGTMPDRTNQPSQWTGYEDIIVQKHPNDPNSQVLITIPNANNYYGFYDNTSVIYANMYLPTSKVAYGVRIGRFMNTNNTFGADDTNSVVGSFTGDANAVASNMEKGKTAYVKGEKVIGTLTQWGNEPTAISSAVYNNYVYFYVPGWHGEDNPYPQGILKRGMKRPLSDFGNATASQVVFGKTFTSEAGYKISGTVPNKGAYTYATSCAVGGDNVNFYVRIPNGAYMTNTAAQGCPEIVVNCSTVRNAVGLTAAKLVKGQTCLGLTGTGTTGIDTSDATATAAYIRKGYTAYAKGSKITGTMNEIKDYYYYPDANLAYKSKTSYTDASGNTQSIASTPFITLYTKTTGYITSASNEIMIKADRFGDATAADVMKGKTFTSKNGLKITGTYEVTKASGVAAPTSLSTIDASDGYQYKKFGLISLGDISGADKVVVTFNAMLYKYSGIVGGGSTTGGKLVVSEVSHVTPGTKYTFERTSSTTFGSQTIMDNVTMSLSYAGSELRLSFYASSGQYFVGYRGDYSQFKVEYKVF